VAAAADPPEGAVRADGLAVLVGGSAGDDSGSVPILLSDLEFEATLLLIQESGSAGLYRRVTETVRREARRRAVLTRLLARQAKQFQEEASPAEVSSIVRALTEIVGGEAAMAELLARYGMDVGDLEDWAEVSLLAATQIRYIEEQVEIPSRREIRERMAADGDAAAGATEEDYRRLILEERLRKTVGSWLGGILRSGRVRLLR
jgi:hypothetical protein